MIDHRAVASETPTLLERRWQKLLVWLEGHGFQAQNIPVECRQVAYGCVSGSRSSHLAEPHTAGNGLFARNACMPGRLLLVVPPKALMNKMTLKRLYPPNIRVDKALTAVQLVSMHIFIWRPKADEDSADPFFGPHISILPRDFGNHPLTWLVLSKLNIADTLRTSLLDSLPPSVLVALHGLHTRFWDDWRKVQSFLRKTPCVVRVPLNSLETQDTVMGFLWAWINVNTRCIYYRLKRAKTDPDNLTMCPILDFANHTPGQAHMMPVPTNADIWNAAPANSIGDGLKFISPDNVKIEENEEIFLTYGLHSNKTLFVEYGFVNLMSDNRPCPSGEVDVQDLVERCVLTDARLGAAVRNRLVTEGYWGGWTLDLTPDGAQPSWRLMTALRLYHHLVAIGSADEDAIQPWQDVVAGKRPWVSRENEVCWRRSLVLLCDTVIARAEKSIGREEGWMSEHILSLWREELSVARAVQAGVLRGDEF